MGRGSQGRRCGSDDDLDAIPRGQRQHPAINILDRFQKRTGPFLASVSPRSARGDGTKATPRRPKMARGVFQSASGGVGCSQKGGLRFLAFLSVTTVQGRRPPQNWPTRVRRTGPFSRRLPVTKNSHRKFWPVQPIPPEGTPGCLCEAISHSLCEATSHPLTLKSFGTAYRRLGRGGRAIGTTWVGRTRSLIPNTAIGRVPGLSLAIPAWWPSPCARPMARAVTVRRKPDAVRCMVEPRLDGKGERCRRTGGLVARTLATTSA